LPPRALVVTSYYETTFQLRGAQILERLRPDVYIVDRNLLTHPYSAVSVRLRLPELAPVLDAGLRRLPLPALDALGRPVFLELAPTPAEDPALPRLVPRGPLAQLVAAVPPPALRVLAEEADARARAALDRGADDHGADRVLAWQDYVAARFYCDL